MSETPKSRYSNMDHTKLTHNDLIYYLAMHIDDRKGWEEFYNRYHRFITATIIKTCRKIAYTRGLNELEDLVHNVYVKLLDKNGKALRDYKGQYKNTIFEWLRVISIRIVLHDLNQASAQSRSPGGKLLSIDQPQASGNHDRATTWKELIPDGIDSGQLQFQELKEEIDYCLKKCTAGSRSPERDRLIFQLYIFEGLDIPTISRFPGINLTEKRVANLISELKEKIRHCLQSRGIRP